VRRDGTTSPALLAVAFALAGCGAHAVHYRNASDPAAGQAQFDADKYQCERDSERPANAGESATPSGMVIDPAQVESCLTELGWHQSGE
jgi:hypothetical protein